MIQKTFDVSPDSRLRMSFRTGVAIAAAIVSIVWAYFSINSKIDGVASDVAAMKTEQRKMAINLTTTSNTVQQFIGYFNAKNGVAGGPGIRVPKMIDEIPLSQP